MKAEFLSPLLLEDLGNGLFLVSAPLLFASAKLNRIVVAPAGLVTDLATIPPYVPGWIVPKLGQWDYPAVIHDAAYVRALQDEKGRSLILSKDQADDLFREGMEAKGVNQAQRNFMWLMVHWFGRGEFAKQAIF